MPSLQSRRVSRRSTSSAVAEGRDRTALLVEREPSSRAPRRVVRSGSWVASASQAQARRPNERDREAGADEATYFAVRPLPLR